MISVFPTISAAGVVLGGVIDYGTGAVYNLQPNPVVANLRCSDTPTVTAPAIVPAVITTPGSTAGPSLETQLLELKSLLDKGLISQEEYNLKRAELLKGL
jgi:hypothetical protein